jgi:opacity protein-like surface antigen
MIMKPLFLLLIGAAGAWAQPVGFGVKGGVPLTDFVDTAQSGNFGYLKHPNRYIVGVQGEIRLPFGLGIEVDALYRHLKYTGTVPVPGTNFSANVSTTGNAWEFPLLLKYRFPSKTIRPFIDGGVAWDTLHGIKQSVLSGSNLLGPNPSELHNTTTKGFVTGVGVDIKLLVIHIQPEVRYTRWGAKHFFDTNNLLNSNQNQAEFLVGLSF